MDPVTTVVTGKGADTKLPPCLYCSLTSYERYYANVTDRLGHVPGRWEYWRCTHCGSAALSPFPKSSDLAAYYPPVYSFSLALGNGSMVKQFLAKIEYLCYFKPQYEAQVRRVLSGLEWSGEKNLRLLDIGCGRGLRLRAFQRRGSTVQGVDIQPAVVQYVESTLGVSAICSELETLSQHFPAQTFEVITAFFVLEHVTDVQAVLRNCYRILARRLVRRRRAVPRQRTKSSVQGALDKRYRSAAPRLPPDVRGHAPGLPAQRL